MVMTAYYGSLLLVVFYSANTTSIILDRKSVSIPCYVCCAVAQTPVAPAALPQRARVPRPAADAAGRTTDTLSSLPGNANHLYNC